MFFLPIFKDFLNLATNSNKQRDSRSLDVLSEEFFSQIPKRIIQQMYDYYKLDFEMFGFEPPTKYISMGYEEDNEHYGDET